MPRGNENFPCGLLRRERGTDCGRFVLYSGWSYIKLASFALYGALCVRTE